MKVGINLLLWTAAAGEEHFAIVKQIESWGYDGVEFPMFSPDCSPWSAFGTELDDLGLGRTAVGVLPEGANLISDDAGERSAAIDHLKACIDSCVELGAEVLCGPLYAPVGFLVGRAPDDDEKKRCAEGLSVVGEHARGSGVVIAVEPLNRFETYFLTCQAGASELVDAVDLDSVGQLYDTFHANIEEKRIAEAIKSSGKRIRHVHISANDRATPGEDHIDWQETFAALKHVGYDGWLTIEAFSAWLPEVAAATCIWRKMAPSEEHVARNGLAFIRESWKV